MAAHTGYLIYESLLDAVGRACSSTILDSPLIYELFELEDVSLALTGILTPGAGAMPTEPHVGVHIPTFLDDYYYRFHIIPSPMDFGLILTDIETSFVLWNSYFEEMTCSNIIDDDLESITITGLTHPFNLEPLQQTEYTVEVPVQGQFILNGDRVFVFENGDTPFLIFTGTRSVVFDFNPQNRIIESLEWLTEIITPKNGISNEQRIAVRSTPRQHFRFSVVLSTEQEQARFDALIFRQLGRQISLPVWTNAIEHLGTLTSGITEITLNTTDTDFRDDSFGIIWQSPNSYRIIKIQSIVGNTITLEFPMLKEFVGPKMIMPLRIGYLDTPIRFQDSLRLRSTAQISFLVSEDLLLTDYTPEVTYKDLPVITRHSVVSDVSERSVDGSLIINDPGVGGLQLFSNSEYNTISRTHRFENKTKSSCWTFKNFLHSLYGRQKPVWLPTFKKDIILAETFSGTGVMTILNTSQLAWYMQLNDICTHVIFMFNDGQKECREIVNITNDGDEELVEIDDPALGRQVTVNNCQISFLHLCRLTQDAVDLTWYRPYQHYSTLDFTVVKYDIL